MEWTRRICWAYYAHEDARPCSHFARSNREKHLLLVERTATDICNEGTHQIQPLWMRCDVSRRAHELFCRLSRICGINFWGPYSDWMPSNLWGLMYSLVDSVLCFLKIWKVIIADAVCLNCADNVDLGTACGKYFRVSSLSITDPGDSDIIKTQDPQA